MDTFIAFIITFLVSIICYMVFPAPLAIGCSIVSIAAGLFISDKISNFSG